MVQMKTNSGIEVNWTVSTDYCEIIGECPRDGRIWEYAAHTRGLKRFMKADYMKAIYGCFEVVGRMVRYSCYVGSDKEIKRWKIFQDSVDGEMWDDIRFLIDGHAEAWL